MDLLVDTYGTFIGATGERITISLPGPVLPEGHHMGVSLRTEQIGSQARFKSRIGFGST